MNATGYVDYVDGVTFEDAKAVYVNMHSLLYAPVGLEKLYVEIKSTEMAYARDPLWSACVMSADYVSRNEFLKTCMFDWFSCTLVSYVRLVGMIKLMKIEGLSDKDLLDSKIASRVKEYSIKYTDSLIPKVLVYRNKVGAHYSFIDPRRDVLDDLRQSVMHNVVYFRGRFRVNALRWGNSTLPDWSLTEEFERLADRFWPHIKNNEPSKIGMGG